MLASSYAAHYSLFARHLDAVEAVKNVRPLSVETQEGSHIRRRPRGDHTDQPDHDKEEVYTRPTPYPACPLPPASWLLWEPAASRPEPLLLLYHHDPTLGPERGAAQHPDRVHIRVYKAVPRNKGHIYSCLSLPFLPILPLLLLVEAVFKLIF
jgi:hypothetical protein